MKNIKTYFILSILVLVFLLGINVDVNAASLNIQSINKTNIMGINTLRLNQPENITYGGIVASRNITETESAFYGAAATPYHVFVFNEESSYASAIYANVGWFNDGTGERLINAVMTLSNFRSEYGYALGSGYGLGFNHYGLTWLLLTRGGGNGLNIDAEIYFYYADDASRQPIDLKSAYIGVGGYNSEKRVWHTGETNLIEETAGIKGAQWEWVSFDSQVEGSIKAYKLSECIMSFITVGQNVHSVDYDINTSTSIKDYGWGISENWETFNRWMNNPTGHNVITNAGNRYGGDIYLDIQSFVGYQKYTNYTVDQTMYMVEVGRVTNYASQIGNIVSTNGRSDGQPFSVYKFQSGKDVGSVELAITPVALATEVTPPSKAVDKITAREQENIKYTITQYMGNMNNVNIRINQRAPYTSLVIKDQLPEEVSYVSAQVKDEYGNVLNSSQCSVNYDGASHTVTFTFSASYLNSTMRYVAEAYTFEINTKVKDLNNSTYQDFIATNKATTTFNNEYTAETNEVRTKILYDIFTKGIHTDIIAKKGDGSATGPSIKNLDGGSDGHTVVFTPEPGYYVETVEWAEFSDKLQDETDIPSNKKLIPEVKDGTEDSYKFDVDIDNSIPDKESLNYDPFGTTTLTFDDIDNNHYIKVIAVPMKMVIRISKEDKNTGKITQGDASFLNAEYTVYKEYDEGTGTLSDKVEVVTLDIDGNGKSSELLLGTYYVKETKAPEGYLIDDTVYTITQTVQNQTSQRLKVSYHDVLSKEEVMKGRIQLIKFDNIVDSTEDIPSEGAILRLTLDSNPSVYYDITINEYGYGEFVDESLREYYPYTIPYGKYTITEIKESNTGEHTHFFIQPVKVSITKQGDNHYIILEDRPVEMYLKIQKIDQDSGLDVLLPGAKFKVWNCTTKSWISQRVYPSGNYIDEFQTNNDGNLILPQKIQAGEYIIYETKAPQGYYLQEEWRIPQNASDIGDPTKGGKYIKIDKSAMGLEENMPATTKDLYYIVDMPNEPLKGKLDIIKKGEVLVGVNVSATKYDDNGLYTPVYELKGLPNVEYTITAIRDIKSPDGTYTYVTAGTKVATITTDKDGYATTGELYLGEYKIEETKTPLGYVTDTNIPNITLANENELQRVATTIKELTNIRQKAVLKFNKIFEDISFEIKNNTEKIAIFGIFANADIRNYNGDIIIHRDSLVDLMRVEGSGEVDSTIDLPKGQYYYKELETSYPYTINEEEVEFTVEHKNTTNLNEVVYGKDIENAVNTTTLTLIKMSTTSMADTVSTPIEDMDFDELVIDEKVREFLNHIKNMTIEEVKTYMHEQSIASAKGAKYGIYLDEECTEPIYMKNNEGQFEELTVTVNEFGMAILDGMPIGKYYIKELEAPAGYELSSKVGTIEMTIANKDSIVYIALCDDEVKDLSISKTDIFTGKEVSNCVFEIAEKETGTVIYKGMTNEDGLCYIPLTILTNGVEYTYTEVSAPDLYDMSLELNTEPHTFVASYDEGTLEWTGEELFAENYRYITDVELLKVDLDDSTVIPNCEFELKSLETDFVVRGTTDENGIYIFKNIPYGEYTYTEISAPDGYLLDTEPHYLKVDAQDIKIVVTNEKAPETGDIAIYAIAGIAAICLLGLVYVFIKNKKKD